MNPPVVRTHDRPNERAEMRHFLDQGASLLVVAPRRIGKTWLMGKLADDLTAAGWETIFSDVEGVDEEAGFLRRLCRDIDAKAGLGQRLLALVQQRFRQATGGDWNSLEEAIVKTDWPSFLEGLIEALDAKGTPTVILIDEISLFIAHRVKSDPAAALQFLYLLRNLRQRHPNVRWVLTGSVGLDTVARRSAMSGALLGLTPYVLGPFSSQEAFDFLSDLSNARRVLRPFRLSRETFDYLEKELGWLSPYYLEHLANQIRPTGPTVEHGHPLATIPDIDRAMDTLLSPQHRLHFAAWEEHLTKNFSHDDQRSLRTILAGCAATAEGEPSEVLLAHLQQNNSAISAADAQNLLTALLNDGFLVEQVRRYRFRSGLVRRYWTKYQSA
jgi:hypothetical protein